MMLEDIRNKIDAIDLKILLLLQERMQLALRSKKFKDRIRDFKREEDLLAHAGMLQLDLVSSRFSTEFLKVIIRESKRLQEEDRKLIGFQGEPGAYGEMASRSMVPSGALIPVMKFADVFQMVQNGHLDLGVVPVENTTDGPIMEVNGLMTESPLFIVGERYLPVQHALMCPKTSDMGDIRMVFSHPQALSQCRQFLNAKGLEAKPFYDTAGAAKMVAMELPKGGAAIASKRSAVLYGLKILKENIQDVTSNRTRFLLLSRRPSDEDGNKTSILCHLPHDIEKIHDILNLFLKNEIRMTRLFSLPLRLNPAHSCFFLDFEGSIKDKKISEVIKKIENCEVKIKFLGTYSADSAVSLPICE